ncbi:hypothetical protein [Corallococcus sp. AS-1-6]|uniref:hypothetical protein n=1 Tax=Corallococcus sp. AS-1-6 TaxID=2874599 RepID=UPI001CBDF94E|nr:hypothetical protein [Corallococcus sp. AS-1-6]MBZ4373216.1 hypothetical protein [Corallococcus sp. AS-1-6]
MKLRYVPMQGSGAVELGTGSLRFDGTTTNATGMAYWVRNGFVNLDYRVQGTVAGVAAAGLALKPDLAARVQSNPTDWEFVYTIGEGVDDEHGASIPFVVYAQPLIIIREPKLPTVIPVNAKVQGDIVVEDRLELYGDSIGYVTVKNGGVFILHGSIGAALIVANGGTAHVYGTVGHHIFTTSGGTVEVRGVVKHHLDTERGGVTKVFAGAVIGGKRVDEDFTHVNP